MTVWSYGNTEQEELMHLHPSRNGFTAYAVDKLRMR